MFSDKLYLFLAGTLSLVVTVVLTIVGFTWWTGAVILTPLIVGGLFLKQGIEHKRRYEHQPVYQPPAQPQPAPPASMPMPSMVLPSAQRDYRFVLDGTILWRPLSTQGMAHPRPDQLAVDAIRERATLVTERESPADCDLVAPRLATELSVQRKDRTGQLEVWAQGVTLFLPEDDRARLHRIAVIRKDEEVWEYERAHERNKRAYLSEDVLSSTGSAVVWWLARDESRVPETVDLIGTFAKLVAAAQGREVEPAVSTFVSGLTDQTYPGTAHDADFVDRLMAEFLPNGSEPERAELADRLATMAADNGATDLARTIREQFDAPDFTETPEADPGLFDAPDSQPVPDVPSPASPNGETPPHAPYTP